MTTLKKYLKRWATILLILVIAVLLARWGINNAYQKAVANHVPFTVPCQQQVWVHRGHDKGTPPNSIAGVKAALADGAPGVEIDIRYKPEIGRFILHHDAIAGVPDKANRLTLDELLSAVHSTNYWWLDAKNLRNLWPWQADDAVARLKHVLMKHQARQQSILETSNPLYLKWVKEAGIGTQFAVKPNDREHPAFAFWTNIYLMKWMYSWGPFNAITMGWERYTPKVREAFGPNMDVQLSTFRDKKRASHYLLMDTVNVVLIEGDFFKLGQCGKTVHS